MSNRPVHIDRPEFERLVAQRKTRAEIAEHFGTSKVTVSNRAKKWGIKLNGTARGLDYGKVRALHADGLNGTEIAAEIGASVTGVSKALGLLGLTPNKPKPKPKVEPKETTRVDGERERRIPPRHRAAPGEVERVLGTAIGTTSCAACGTQFVGGTLLSQSRAFRDHTCVLPAGVRLVSRPE